MDSSLDDWIVRDAISFSIDSPTKLHAAIGKLIGSIGDSVELLGLGEPLHGGEEFLLLRNRLFQRLVEAHGFTAIAVESSFPRARAVNDYLAGAGAASYDDVRQVGFSHGFGELEANRELVQWMRAYNADPAHPVKLRFYGFDGPMEMVNTDSPRALVTCAIDYLTVMDSAKGRDHRARIEAHLGQDADWENPAAMMDPAQSVGLSPSATALRVAVENLISELRSRRPEFAATDNDRYQEALHCASAARQLLNYHATLARTSATRIEELLAIRDLMMADNLAYMVQRELGRGRVLAFAHNSHLKRGRAQWQLGPQRLTWWPAGAQLVEMLGARYAVIGAGVGLSADNGINPPEALTLEARLTAAPGPARFMPTHSGQHLSATEIAALPTRSASVKNSTYFPLNAESFTDFDWLAMLDATRYSRGGPPLP